MRRVVLASLGIAFGAFACGGGEGGGGVSAEGGAAAGPSGPMGQASITGTVNFQGTPPANPSIDMAEEPACRSKYQGQPRDPQVVVNGGKLANVFVYVKSGLLADAEYTAPSTPVILDQDGCLYLPRVFGVMAGQTIEIRNSDPLLHNIKAVPQANRGFNISQPREGMTTSRSFSRAEVMVPFECNVHGWMNAYVGVVAHPFFATSGENGSFTIPNLPAGTYELEAWHEKFGSQTTTVTVPESGTVQVEFAFSAPAS